MSGSISSRILFRLPFASAISPLQASTYLLCVCLFSISFLVFLNSSISYVITDLLDIHKGVGDSVGTLGFADELVALVACPVWGVLSDRVGVRTVVCLGYGIVGLSLFVFVQAKNVYPQLLLARIFFSIGGAATATMVTALLPVLTGAQQEDHDNTRWCSNGATTRAALGGARRSTSGSISSELTITPAIFSQRSRSSRENSTVPETIGSVTEVQAPISERSSTPPRLAGLVGVFTGCGALVALMIFLRLPFVFLKHFGVSPAQAVTDSYFVVGTIALIVSAFAFFGLRNLIGEEGKGWRAMLGRYGEDGRGKYDILSSGINGDANNRDPQNNEKSQISYWKSLSESIMLGFKNFNIGLGYLGGFVARASSVGISLFIPLFVNTYFISSGLCHGDPTGRTEDMKRECRRSYVLASELTGVSQLVALLCAPLFGYLSDRYRRFNIPLLVSSLVGVLGYVGFALLKSPEPSNKNGNGGSPFVFLLAAMIGISQIGAIVCSLGLLGRGVLGESGGYIMFSQLDAQSTNVGEPPHSHNYGSVENLPHSQGAPGHSVVDEDRTRDSATLLNKPPTKPHSHLKGSIAGVYSLAGGAGILLLTKLGGYLFDNLSCGAPFYMLAIFNGVLFVVGVSCGVLEEVYQHR